jgi:hypothetical protein
MPDNNKQTKTIMKGRNFIKQGFALHSIQGKSIKPQSKETVIFK